MGRCKGASLSVGGGIPSMPSLSIGHASHVAKELRTLEMYSAKYILLNILLGARNAKSSSKEIDTGRVKNWAQ